MSILPGAEKAYPHSSREDEAEALQQQILFTNVNVSFFSIFRYVTKSELTAGAIVPVPPILFAHITDLFANIGDGGKTHHASERQVDHYTLYFVYLGPPHWPPGSYLQQDLLTLEQRLLEE
ncbi:MAG: hypothetical protein Q9217_006562 [Psora testacea]